MSPAVLFDWGGVFTIGTFDGRATTGLAQAFGKPLATVEQSYFARIAHLELGQWTLAQFWQALAAELEINAPVEEFREIFLGSIAPNPEVNAIAEALAGKVARGLLSNNYPEISGFLRQSRPFSQFEALVFSNEEGVKKPDPQAFALAAARLNREPEQILFVDDVDSNLTQAAQLGFLVHQFSDAATLRQALAETGIAL